MITTAAATTTTTTHESDLFVAAALSDGSFGITSSVPTDGSCRCALSWCLCLPSARRLVVLLVVVLPMMMLMMDMAG